MRISTNQLFDRSIQHILDNQGDLSDIQRQLATGKKILRPSDDPVGAAQVMRLTEELERIDQYKTNNTLLKNSLTQEEAILQSVTDSVLRARQLAVQAGSGINDDQDRQALGVEIGQIRDQVFDLMNARNADGEYIFAGNQSDSPAFIFDPNAVGNHYIFQGDTGQNKMQLSNTVTVASGDSGFGVFENVLARLDADITGGTAASSLRITQQGAFDTFHQNNYDAVAPANNVYTGTINGVTNQIDFINAGTLLPAGSASFVSGEPFTFNGMDDRDRYSRGHGGVYLAATRKEKSGTNIR